MNNYEKTFALPSNGAFGGPKEITLRAMTTKEEKIMLTSRDMSVFDRIVKSCCVEPKDLDIGLLHSNDIMYLIYAIRQITFGDTYTQESTCEECKHRQSVEVDINEMTINYLDTENLEEKLTVKLPKCGDTLKLKLLSIGDNNRLDKQVKSKTASGRLQDPDSYSFSIKLMEMIETRNGEEITDLEEKRHYVDNLHMMDYNAISKCLSQFNFGLDNSIVRECENCGATMNLFGVICPEFFRPSL